MQTNIYQNKTEFRLLVTQTFQNIIQLKKDNNRSSFNELVLKIMPEMRKYINGRLNTALKKGHFSKGKYKADDIIDQLFIEIYDTIEDIDNENEFYLWLFKKTNDLLEDIIVEEEFDDFFFKNIDDYSQPEWDEMQEEFSTDADDDLIMIEELDDMSYNHNNYTLNHVFVEDNEKALAEKLDKSINDEKIQNHVAMVLHNLPSDMRNVFDLFTNQHLELEEIALIRNKTLEEVKQLLYEAKKSLQVSLFNRYADDN
jgi:RNA polymerase sigma factor (sigma-70 family)